MYGHKIGCFGRNRYKYAELTIGLIENLVGASAASGLGAFFGAGSAVNGLNSETYKAFYWRDDRAIEVEYELWKEEQEWLSKNG